MKTNLLIFIYCLLLVLICCIKTEKNIPNPIEETPDDISINFEHKEDIYQENENLELYLKDPIKIEFSHNETKGVTDIIEEFLTLKTYVFQFFFLWLCN